MFKFSKLESSGIQDTETAKDIFVSTTIRKYFRENIINKDVDGNAINLKLSNEELNNTIAKHVINSSRVKTIRTKDGWGEIRRNNVLGIYFILSWNPSESFIKVISAKEKINEEKTSGKYPSLINTGIQDPISQKEIRVSTTARIAFKKIFPYALINKINDGGSPSDVGSGKVTIGEASPVELSVFIAEQLRSNASQDSVKKIFKTRNDERAEIRYSGIKNLVFIAISREYFDIISIQDSYRKVDSPREGQKRRISDDKLSVNRPTYKGEKALWLIK